MNEARLPEASQLITIEPSRYVAEVYEPFTKRFEAAKVAAREVKVDITTKEGMELAVQHRNVFKRLRIDLEDARVARKKPILEIGRLLDSAHKPIEAQIITHEKRFDDPIQEVVQKEKREAAARVEAAMEAAKAAERAKREAEEKELADARAEIARKTAELAALEKAAADKIEADGRAARMRIEEEGRVARQEREEADAEARRIARIEQDRVDAERRERQRQLDEEAAKVRAEAQALEDSKRKEQARLDAIAKAEREEAENRERDKRIAEQQKADGYAALRLFVQRNGKNEEFTPIVAAINQFLESRK